MIRDPKHYVLAVLCFTALMTGLPALAATGFDFAKSTPVGSWQVREDVTTDEKGRQFASVIKTSLLEKVDVEGEPYYWTEMEMQNYKVKKGERKKSGDRMIIKTLISAEVMGQDGANVVGNLQKYAREIIIQNGNNDPMRITEGGAFASAMMQAAGVKMDYDYQSAGSRTVKTPAGEISCNVLKGKGSAEAKILIKTIRSESEMELCYSNQVPFGIVQSTANITTNGKSSTSETVLTEYGKTGAKSNIVGEPVEAPQMPKLFN